MTEHEQQKEKENKINQIKQYLDDLSYELNSVLEGSRTKMEKIIKKSEEEKIKKVLDDLKSM